VLVQVQALVQALVQVLVQAQVLVLAALSAEELTEVDPLGLNLMKDG
jgi:hypothetical protein